MSEFLDFLKNLPEGNLYCDHVFVEDDDDPMPYYVHVSKTGELTSFNGGLVEVDIQEIIACEIKNVQETIDYYKSELNKQLNKIKLLESVIDSDDNIVLENFFNKKDFSDNAFRELRETLTNPLFEIRILSEFEGGGERVWGWDANDVILRYDDENWFDYFKYEMFYDIKDDLEHTQREVEKQKTKISNLEKTLKFE